MALKYICDICGEEVSFTIYYELELRGSVLEEGGYENIDSIGGHKKCMQDATGRTTDLFDSLRKSE